MKRKGVQGAQIGGYEPAKMQEAIPVDDSIVAVNCAEAQRGQSGGQRRTVSKAHTNDFDSCSFSRCLTVRKQCHD